MSALPSTTQRKRPVRKPQNPPRLDASAPRAARLKRRYVSPRCSTVVTLRTSVSHNPPWHVFLSPRHQFALDEKMDTVPSGVKWLSDPKIMQTYLSLLGSAQKDGTLEACCGALQNLTASGNLVSMHTVIIQLSILLHTFSFPYTNHW